MRQTFIPILSLKGKKAIAAEMIPYAFAMKMRFTNSGAGDRSFYLYPGSYFGRILGYKIKDVPVGPVSDDQVTGYVKITLNAGETSDVMLWLRPLKNDFNSFNVRLISQDFIEDYLSSSVSTRNDIHIFGMVLSGIVLMMILFMLANYMLAPRPEFLYNALYSLSGKRCGKCFSDNVVTAVHVGIDTGAVARLEQAALNAPTSITFVFLDWLKVKE